MTHKFILEKFYDCVHWQSDQILAVIPKDKHTIELKTIFGPHRFTFYDTDHFIFEKGWKK